jgi:hypothetical protein
MVSAMDTRPTLAIVRDCIAVVRDVLLIAGLLVLAYVVLRTAGELHDLQQIGN